MNIVYLSPYFWPEEIGSAPYCTDLAAHLVEQGHSVRAIAFRPHYPSSLPFQAWQDGHRDAEQHRGVRIERVGVMDRGAGGLRVRLGNDLRYLWSLLRKTATAEFRETDVIVAYVPGILTALGARVVRLLTGARLMVVVHDIESGLARSVGTLKRRWQLGLLRGIERFALNGADSVVVLTEEMRQELRSLGVQSPMAVLPIWAETAPPRSIRPKRRPVVMYSGNFGKKQGLDQLLPLLEGLGRRDSAVSVHLRGNGSERQRLEAEVRDRAIPNVDFLPLVPAEDLMSTLQDANIHLVPQARDVANYAMPSKLVSIMAAGRPFVCVAPPESPLDRLSRQTQAGLCVAPDAPELLVDTVTALLDDPIRQRDMGRRGQTYVRNHMAREVILARFTAMILALGAKKALAARKDDLSPDPAG